MAKTQLVAHSDVLLTSLFAKNYLQNKLQDILLDIFCVIL